MRQIRKKAGKAMGNIVKVKDMKYVRTDTDAECRALEDAAERARRAKSGKELAGIRERSRRAQNTFRR